MIRPPHAAALLGVVALQACASMHPSVKYRATMPAGELRILEHSETIAECGSPSAFPWEQCAELRAPTGNDLEVVWWYLGEVARSRVQIDGASELHFIALWEGRFGETERTIPAPEWISLSALRPETALYVDDSPGAHSSQALVFLEIHNAGDVTIAGEYNGYGGELAGEWFVWEAGGWLHLRVRGSIGCGTGIAENPFVLAPGETRGAIDPLAPARLPRDRPLRFAARVRPVGAEPTDAWWQVEITGHVGADGRFVVDDDDANVR